jgi:hypothetical protein
LFASGGCTGWNKYEYLTGKRANPVFSMGQTQFVISRSPVQVRALAPFRINRLPHRNFPKILLGSTIWWQLCSFWGIFAPTAPPLSVGPDPSIPVRCYLVDLSNSF